MKLHIRGIKVTLVGTPSEFGEVVGYPEGNTNEVRKVLGDLATDAGLTTSLKGGGWNISGTWKQFADFIGYPEASTESDFSMAFKRLHPEVEITLTSPLARRHAT